MHFSRELTDKICLEPLALPPLSFSWKHVFPDLNARNIFLRKEKNISLIIANLNRCVVTKSETRKIIYLMLLA